MRKTVACTHCVALIAVLATVGGCGRSSPVPEPVRDDGDASTTIAVSLCAPDDSRHRQMKADIESAAGRHADVKLILGTATDAGQQSVEVEQFIEQAVDLIIVSAAEPQALTGPVTEAFERGIPVILLHRPIVGDKYTCFITTDSKKTGTMAGQWLAGRLGGKGKIVELKGSADSPLARGLHDGFHAALRDPGYRIFEKPIEWEEAKAREAMKELLGEYDQIDAVFAHSDSGALGAYQAAKTAGREKDTIFIGVGGVPQEGMAHVADGILDATLEHPTGGAEAVDLATRILAGEDVPRNVTLDSRVYAK